MNIKSLSLSGLLIRGITVCIILNAVIGYEVAASYDISRHTVDNLTEIAEGIVEWKKEAEGLSPEKCLVEDHLYKNAGESYTDWFVIGIASIRKDKSFPVYLYNLKKKAVKDHENVASDSISPIDFIRMSLAINSLGADATNTGEDNPDFISEYIYNRKNLNNLINTLSWGLITLDSKKHEVPEDSLFDRRDIIKNILKLQIPGNGFALTGLNSDPDVTAMVIQALAPYYEDDFIYCYENLHNKEKYERTVREVIDDCLEVLSRMQLAGGDYRSWGNQNSQTGAQVIIALSRLGIDIYSDERFIKEGNTLIDGLLNYRLDNGGFENLYGSGRADNKAGEQALLAVAALMSFLSGEPPIYDFTKTREYYEPETSSVPDETQNNKEEDNTILFISMGFIAIIIPALLYYGKRRKKKF